MLQVSATAHLMTIHVREYRVAVVRRVLVTFHCEWCVFLVFISFAVRWGTANSWCLFTSFITRPLAWFCPRGPAVHLADYSQYLNHFRFISDGFNVLCTFYAMQNETYAFNSKISKEGWLINYNNRQRKKLVFYFLPTNSPCWAKLMC